MQVGDPLAPLGAGASGSGRAQNQGELGKEEFLKLLTAQLTHQDPLSPMENQEFVAQLAQFSSLEQLIGLGEGMQNLAVAQAVSNGTNMVGMIGKEVSYVGDGISHKIGGTHDLNVDLADTATRVTVTVHDADGKVVRTIEAGPSQSGTNAIEWDGKDNNGQAVAEGDYTFKVSAEDENGKRVETSTQLRGTVTGVTYESGYPELIINGQRIAVGQVVEVGIGSDDTNDNSEPEPDPNQVDAPGEEVLTDQGEA
jgi:flagellar basal-body rod modification protein FlgD